MSENIANEAMNNKLWKGSFKENLNKFVEQFTESITIDSRLYREDIEGSIAHVKMLHSCGLVKEEEKDTIINTLNEIEGEIRDNKIELKTELEDIHMNIESELIKRIGDIGRKLHTGRSRNDQIVTDLRLYTRKHIDIIIELILTIMKHLTDHSDKHTKTIMPGFTHFQIAQPISLGHYLLAYASMFQRDINRLIDCRKRVNINPLGSAALAGTTHHINRYLTSKLLDFDKPSENSLDSISDRDFVIEFISTCCFIIMHLSRISEEFIIFMNPQFNFLTLPESFLTGSSIMPQKKNPDVLELIRGKTGRIYANLINILTTMKCQTLAYNKDLQEDKIPLFDTVDNIIMCLVAFGKLIEKSIFNEQKMYETAAKGKLIEKSIFNEQKMYETAAKGFSISTDLADYLVKKGLPFRTSHEIVGSIIKYCNEKHKTFSDLSFTELKTFHSYIKDDIIDILCIENSIKYKNHIGGTSPEQVKISVQNFRFYIQKITNKLEFKFSY
uniref:Argininosuccinate lyase n=1 Tax=Pachypsylla venusta TaxID=38123 RepID=A0A0A1HAC9_PACVE|nr:argininosuccinate lyase [Pachypsylla venusta]BAP90751.1 argininosuccinate lyase [Pachypsylla venusta]